MSLTSTRSFVARTTSGWWRRDTDGAGGAPTPGPSLKAPGPGVFRRFYPLFFTHFTQGVHITLPFIISAYMVRDFVRAETGEKATSEQTVGRLAGLLGASYCGSQLLTSYLIGRLSDRIGRKPIMVVGNVACLVSAVMFGLAGSYPMAVLARVVGALPNGILGAEKAMLGDALSVQDQGKAFGYFSLAWGLGALVGPALGGALANPCTGVLQSSAACASGSLLQQRPYLLPCLVAAGTSVVATVLTVLLLEETLPALCRGRAGGAGAGSYAAVPTADDADAGGLQTKAGGGAAGRAGSGKGHAAEGDGLGRELELGQLPAAGATAGAGSKGGAVLGKLPFRNDSAREELVAKPARSGSGSSSGGSSPRVRALQPGEGAPGEGAAAGFLLTEDEELGLLGQPAPEPTPEQQTRGGKQAGVHVASSTGGGSGPGSCAAAPDAAPWYRQRGVILSLAGYSLIAFEFNMIDELVPIFASAPPGEGGLGFPTSQLAPSLIFGGTVLTLWALWGFPALLRRWGNVRVCRFGLWGTPPFILLFPAASLFVGRLPKQLTMFLAMGLRGISSTNAFTACIVIVNALAPPGTLGSVNGAGQTLAAFVRSVAPALGGLSWGWSTTLSMDGHQFLPFVFVCVVALGTLLVYRDLEVPATEVEPVESVEEEEEEATSAA